MNCSTDSFNSEIRVWLKTAIAAMPQQNQKTPEDKP